MFYSEIIKIIEAGLERDKDKVKNYSILLAKKLERDGDIKASQRVELAINKRNGGNAITDALIAPPVDQESRLGIVDIDYNPSMPEIVLSESTKTCITDFENTISIKEKLEELGIPYNLSLLLYGPPGCGKTSIANCIANRLNLPLVTARLDTLISSFLGNTSKNLRRLFDFATRQPCVLFLDEFDAIAKARNDKNEMGELKRVVNSLLQNMDAYCQSGILIAATNHQELLDDATWRRFQTIIEVPKPESPEIETLFSKTTKILNTHLIKPQKQQIIIEQMQGLSYSEIQTSVQNVIKKQLVKKDLEVTALDFLCEIALFKYHGNISRNQMFSYLNKCGISQRTIAEYYQISLRQVHNYLENKEGDKNVS